MKQFVLIPTSLSYGVFYDGDKISLARFLTPAEAKFEASFRSISAAPKG